MFFGDEKVITTTSYSSTALLTHFCSVPWVHKVLEADDVFKNSDPFDGRWNDDPNYHPERKPGEPVWGPWDDIYSG
jgi:hypothetical protein